MKRPDPFADGPTVRTVIDALLDKAARLPLGLDTPLKLGVCDAESVRLLNYADIILLGDVPVFVGQPFAPGAEATVAVLLRAHRHPWDAPGNCSPKAAGKQTTTRTRGTDTGHKPGPGHPEN
jgi:hypothetical protein